MSERRVQNISEAFFNDGHWYTLTSAALGELSPEALSSALQDDTGRRVRELMEGGVCLPLAFDADCVLDLRTRFVVGELSGEEEAEWVARIRAPLHLPDGTLALVAGAMPEDFEAIGTARADGYVTLELEPGRYVAEVYAYVGSYTVNELFYREGDRAAKSSAEAPSTKRLQRWWRATRGDAPLPEWLERWAREGYVDNDACGLLAYVVRLARSDEKVPVPPQDEDYGWWVTEFEAREPALCPHGIKFRTS